MLSLKFLMIKFLWRPFPAAAGRIYLSNDKSWEFSQDKDVHKSIATFDISIYKKFISTTSFLHFNARQHFNQYFLIIISKLLYNSILEMQKKQCVFRTWIVPNWWDLKRNFLVSQASEFQQKKFFYHSPLCHNSEKRTKQNKGSFASQG